ncbi:MAG: DUF4389 domain-containing protein [Pseudohongiellaceae bacterium]|nr:DUF4389 domain-containing protein [Pseudohongiellaceae bacterium]
MSDDIVDNLKEPSQWLRIAFMIAFAVALYVAISVLVVLTVAQALFCLVTGRDNKNLRGFGKGLGAYVHEIVEYLTYNSQQKPFPFSEFPETDLDDDDDLDTDELEDDLEEEIEEAVEAELEEDSDLDSEDDIEKK